jgi:hypothetical protein
MGIHQAGITGLGDREVLMHLRGTVHAEVPGQPLRMLFGCHGFTVSRPITSGDAHRGDGNGEVVGREVLLWTDPVSGAPLEEWENPFTGEAVEVLHDWLDPMNLERTAALISTESFGIETQHVWHSSTVSAPALRADVFKREVSSSAFGWTEMVRYTQSSRTTSIVRMHPWLPWMLMGPHDGRLIIHIGGCVVDGGFAGLPDDLRAYVMANRPEFAFAPSSWESPNENSWSLYGKERHPR